MLRDVFPFKRAIDKSQSDDDLNELEQRIAASIALVDQRHSALPSVDYPSLPVTEQKDKISRAIRDNQVVIVAGETGSGKTTQLPKICLELGRGVKGLIGHTQPRRLAARSVSSRIAEELNTSLGDAVGFKIRFDDKVSDASYIKLMTDGILLAEIQQDRFLNDYDTLIIDEAHERSLNIDFILGYLKQLLPRRPDLKVIITSATIDPERFSKHFNNAPMIEVSGRTYPVEMRYRPLMDDEGKGIDQIQGIVEAVKELKREPLGDILVFLSGEREIRDTAEALKRQNWHSTEILPLYARLSAAEQNRIFKAHPGLRIVLSTNVAETSLTVPGIKYVIDPGTARISRYSTRSKVQRLPIEAVSQASANQRAGRCGRVSDGVCIRLYSEDDYQGRTEFTDPEILRTNLASVMLQMMSLRLGEIEDFPFVQPPDSRQIADGRRLLEELGALTRRSGRLGLSPIGRDIARLPIDPRYGRMVVEASTENALQEVIVIAAGLSIQDPRERPQDKRQQADEAHESFRDKESDFLSLWNLWTVLKEQQKNLSSNQFRKWCQNAFVNYLRVREWQDIVSQLKKQIVPLHYRLNNLDADYGQIHRAIASGLLSHIGFKDKDREYLGARNSRFAIFPGSGLSKSQPKWVMAAELVETSRLFARVVAKIDPSWLEGLAAHLVKREQVEPHWSKRRGEVVAFENVKLYGLPIVVRRRVGFAEHDPGLARELFIREALVNGLTRLRDAFLLQNQRKVAAIVELEDKSRRRDLLVDEDDLVAFYAERIPESINKESTFSKWWRNRRKQMPTLLDFDPSKLIKQEHDASAEQYPDVWTQGNLRLPLSYVFDPKAEDDGVSLMIPLPMLNQVTEQGFDWLVPGLRHELIVTLIKSLPKRLRKNFVPAPNYADACMGALTPHQGSFLEALGLALKKMTGIEVPQAQWQWDAMPNHLRFHFKVIDEDDKLLGQGRDLGQLKQSLKGHIKDTLQSAATPEIEQDNILDWSLGDLPRDYVSRQGSYEIKAYPALVAKGKNVGVKLFDTPEAAADSHRVGLRQLLLLNAQSPVKYLQEKLPNKAKLGLYFNPFGQVKQLIDDCIAAAVDSFAAEGGDEVRTQAQFTELLDSVRGGLNERVLEIAKKVEKGLTRAHGIHKKMKGSVPLNMINAHGDIKSHLDSLVYAQFVSDIGAQRLDDWNRYLEGIARRLDKLAVDPSRDRVHQLSVEKVQQAWQNALERSATASLVSRELTEVRWMIEELRVSFFAQQLGTKIPISEKRVLNYLNSL